MKLRTRSQKAVNLLLFTAGLAQAYWVVKHTWWGPVVLTLSEERGWGIHTGDAAALPGLALALLALLRFRGGLREPVIIAP